MALSNLPQLHLRQLPGPFLTVAGDERHRGSHRQKGQSCLDLGGFQVEFSSNLLMKGTHLQGSVSRVRSLHFYFSTSLLQIEEARLLQLRIKPQLHLHPPLLQFLKNLSL
ncbi:hypothetical protein XM38_025820 [Halomicronema hongdechloris C2206]|uniref:Uncharacterized protein n=1 Tax=Halomicronema hongdechloris C2206 TaxID=1641165 RepID=A0A1Z3HMV5_9CYAN|nr:hypothetical protein XM38_025820 [Halomicronema hongdechloris C2206]